MGVYIKDMEMPTSCNVCELAALVDISDGIAYGCRALKEMIYNDRERLPNCPLVEIPPHGRLIDADALVEDLERQCKEVFRIDAVSPDDYWITRNEAYNEALWKTWVESFDNYLKTRPTVIPTDKDGET